MAVSEILSEKGGNVITIEQQTTLEEAAKILSNNKIGALVVVTESEQVCGIVSERDIVRDIANAGANALEKTVSECMTHRVVSCSSDDLIDTLMEKMTEGKFRHLPVIDNGVLKGIISIGDVVKRKIEQAERDAEEMKRYIAG
ncbi:MAG: CBS domain-containing protein [Rhizobiaceae bacterium]|nr:CBS domain-containing protein [Rhizobiaceae bacterium]